MERFWDMTGKDWKRDARLRTGMDRPLRKITISRAEMARHVEVLSGLTGENYHTTATWYIADKVLRHEGLATLAQAVDDMCTIFGGMDSELSALSEKVRKLVSRAEREMLTEADRRELWSSM